MERKKLPLLICANLLIIAAIGYVDYLSSSEIEINLIPVFPGTCYAGHGWGVLLSLPSPFFSLFVDYTGHEAPDRGITARNA